MAPREVVKTSGVCCWRRLAGSLWPTAERKSTVAWSLSLTMLWMNVVLMVRRKEMMGGSYRGKESWVSVIVGGLTKVWMRWARAAVSRNSMIDERDS